jgi:Cu(I)/Ag(I) efflux system protein CusF
MPLVLLATAACAPPESERAAGSGMEEMATDDMAVTDQTIRGVGIVTAVDAAAGTITLDHEAIEALNWPAMTMQFSVETTQTLEGVAVGDRVTFELKGAEEPQTIVSLREQ